MPRQVQVGPENYFEAALRILADNGVPGLKIGVLCSTLKVTSGSFYHHFGGWDEFVGQLLEYWETEQTRRVMQMTHLAANPWEQLDVLKQMAVQMPHDAEAAIRAWGRGDATVNVVQRRVDELRHDSLRDVIIDVGVEPSYAELLATMGLTVLAGFQQVRSGADTEELAALLSEVVRLVAARATLPPPVSAPSLTGPFDP